MNTQLKNGNEDPVNLAHASLSPSSDGPALQAIFTKCKEGPCPTIYVDADGNYAVQGFKIAAPERTGAVVPEHEDVVRLPKDFLDEFIRSRKA